MPETDRHQVKIGPAKQRVQVKAAVGVEFLVEKQVPRLLVQFEAMLVERTCIRKRHCKHKHLVCSEPGFDSVLVVLASHGAAIINPASGKPKAMVG